MPQIKPKPEPNYITPDSDKFTQPSEKLFDFWSFIIGVMTIIGIYLWWRVVKELIIN